MTIILTNRRTLFKGLFAVGIASPVIIKPENLMMIDNPDNRIVISYRSWIGRWGISIANHFPGDNVVAKILNVKEVYSQNEYQLSRRGDIRMDEYRDPEEVKIGTERFYIARTLHDAYGISWPSMAKYIDDKLVGAKT